ncbi:hypothetical protein GCM10010287_37210 [Streptomyces variabilis]|uniref:Transposase n=2 Tax=Streptomyces TaxID=1883 RepID=A0ABP7ZCK3_9ACTN|nr:hypothetical protein GCM10010265_61750 [Streptomyces griseoincarnatus]GGT59541.1 hypothetical protein GCM10010287_37210 [Streptomyces variabilis]
MPEYSGFAVTSAAGPFAGPAKQPVRTSAEAPRSAADRVSARARMGVLSSWEGPPKARARRIRCGVSGDGRWRAATVQRI